MKLTKEKLKELIEEEISYLSEQEGENQKIDAAQKALESEAKAIFSKIKLTADQQKLDLEMLKKSFIDFFQNLG
tara:strand:+ start:629 stop:850 length:222 start_codon:yes stop_codon:yes gene_type:complete